MRAIRILALAAAFVVPAAAHAQAGVYLGAPVRYAAPAYGYGEYYARPHWDHRIYGRPYVYGPGGAWVGPPVYGGFHNDWRGYRHERAWADRRGGRW